MKSTLRTILLTIAAAGLCAAQMQYRGGSDRPRAGSNLDMAKVQTIAGTVGAVNVGYGMEYPSITIGKAQIKVAPVWYLLDNNFEIKVGDALSVVAAPSVLASDPYLYAVEMTKSATGQRIVLRDASGRPLWAAPQTSAGAQTSAGGYATCLLTSTPLTAAGTVQQINMGLGIQFPTLTLKTADGSLLTFKLGPERVLLASDLELKPGDSITVKYASSACCDEFVALAITDAAGITVVLRDGNGGPVW